MLAALKTPTAEPILLRRRGSSSKRYSMIPISHKTRSASILGALTLMGGLAGGAGIASAYSGEELAKTAKVTLDEARAIALKARPGAINDQELEKEKGGSGLRYSFDIKDGKTTYEVGVDAQTGKVLENAAEGAHPDQDAASHRRRCDHLSEELFASCGRTAGFERRREAFQNALLEGGDNRLVDIRAPANGRRVGEFFGGCLHRLEDLLTSLARAIGRHHACQIVQHRR